MPKKDGKPLQVNKHNTRSEPQVDFLISQQFLKEEFDLLSITAVDSDSQSRTGNFSLPSESKLTDNDVDGLLIDKRPFAENADGTIQVYKATYNDQSIAVKDFRKYISQLSKEFNTSSNRREKKELKKMIASIYEEIERERELVGMCRHPNIIALISEIPTRTHHIALELAPNGTLKTLLSQESASIHNMANRVVLNIVMGIEYLHSEEIHILHGDLKPANIVLTEEMEAKICDLGNSKVLNNEAHDALEVFNWELYTLGYCPAESNSKPIQACRASDIFALGGILAAVHYNQGNYLEDSEISHIARHKNALYDEVLPKKAQAHEQFKGTLRPAVSALIAMCWQKNPSARPTAQVIRQTIELEESTITTPTI